MNESIIGKRFGKLVVLNDWVKVSNGRKYNCQCDCGETTYVYRGKLTSGHTKSCGCITKSLGGLSDHKLYSVWSNMKDRCYNENNHAYHNYGGKGIIIYDEWLNNFSNFYEWAIKNGYKEGLSIDRIDSDKNYEPNNCQWITKSCNTTRANEGSHKRKTKYKYYGISPDGIEYIFPNASAFALEYNLSASSIRSVANGKTKKHKGWKFGFTGELNL